jgi:protein-disulfide isomerase
VDEGIRGRLIALERDHVEAVHQARSAALSERIDAGLLVEESLRRGMPVDELQEAEAAARAAPVTDADLEAFYEENQARIQGSLDEVRERLRGYLQRSREAESRRAYLQELREAARVELLLPEPAFPRVAVAATGPARGPDDAPVTMIVFSEFQCPYCAQASPVLASLSEEYGDRLRVVFRDFPLPSHSLAQKASEAAHCAGLQGAFWAMHDRLFAHPRELDVASLKAHARALGLDGAAFDGCLDEGRTAKVVTDNRDAGREAGVTGTPAFFINGRYLSGARPAETFRALIDEELARAGS